MLDDSLPTCEPRQANLEAALASPATRVHYGDIGAGWTSCGTGSAAMAESLKVARAPLLFNIDPHVPF